MAAPCVDCGNVGENWLCLECGEVRCSRYVKGHNAAHVAASANPQHACCASFSDLSFWWCGQAGGAAGGCRRLTRRRSNQCDSYIVHDTLMPYLHGLHAAKFGITLGAASPPPAQAAAGGGAHFTGHATRQAVRNGVAEEAVDDTDDVPSNDAAATGLVYDSSMCQHRVPVGYAAAARMCSISPRGSPFLSLTLTHTHSLTHSHTHTHTHSLSLSLFYPLFLVGSDHPERPERISRIFAQLKKTGIVAHCRRFPVCLLLSALLPHPLLTISNTRGKSAVFICVQSRVATDDELASCHSFVLFSTCSTLVSMSISR